MTSPDPWASTAQEDKTARIQITVALVTTMNLGDHGARVRQPVQVILDETVEAMVRRVFAAIDAKYRTHDTADVIEIQALPLPDEVDGGD